MNNGTISLIRNNGDPVKNNIVLTGNDGQDTSVTVTVGNKSQKFQTGSVVTATKDANGNATELTINGNSYGIKAGKHTTLVDGENTKATLVKDDDTGTQYKVDVDLSKYAKTEDVAVVYNKKKTSLYSTNASVAENAIALGRGASAVKNSIAIGNGAYTQDGTLTKGQSVALGNGAVTGAKSTSIGSNAVGGHEGTITIGANANNGSLYATIIGTDSVINSDETAYKVKIDTFLGPIEKDVNIQGATATLVGTSNKVDNKNNLVYSGVANNVMGAANTIEASNGVTIQGTGNKVTDAYKDMNITTNEGLAILGGDYSVLAKKQSGAIAVVGGANTVSKQTDSTVIGYDNRLIGGEENISHDVFMAGSHNRLDNVSDSIVMGNENAITGVSNVISFGHKNAITANNAVAIGNGAGVSVEGGVALGVGSVASTDAGAPGYGAAEGETGIAWKATNGAVSVGSSVEGKKITRQITNVAAGTEDTDAVNVAQLKKVSEAAASASQGWKLKTQNGNASDVKPGATVEFDGDANIQVGNDGNKVSVTLKNQLTGIQSITGAGEGAGSISFANDGIKFNNKVTIDNTGKISGVADGKISTDSTDAVNGSQLHAVATEAGKHTTLSNGKNTTVESTVKDGQTDYKVNVAGDLTDITSVANGDSKINLNKDSIIISNGNKYFAITNSGIGMSYIGADYSAKSIMLGENGTTISGGLNVAGSKITGVAAGEADTDAVNVSQLQKVSDTANAGWNLSTNGVATKATNVKPGDYVDFSGDKNISVSNDKTKVKVELNKDLVGIESISNGDAKMALNGAAGTAGMINGKGASIYMQDGYTVINSKVAFDQNGKISGVATGAVTADSTDAVNGSQLHAVQSIANKGWNLTTAHGETTTVKPGDTVDFSPEDTNLTVTNEGTNVKIGLNQDLHLTSATFGDTIINANGLTIGHGTAGLEFSQNRVSVGGQQIHDVADGKDNTDAVNVGQLKQVADAATSNDKRLVQNPNDSDGSYQVKENGDVTLRVEDSNKNGYNVTIKDVASKAELDKVKTDVGNVDGFHDEIKNKDTNGKPTHTSVVDAVNNLDTKVNTIQSDVTKATEEAKKHSSVSTGNGLDLDVTDNNGQKDYKVSLKDDFTLGGKDGHTGSIEFKGSEGNITASGTLTATAVSVGNTSISDTGLQIGNKTSLTEDALTIGGNTYITDKGIDANQQKISNVADGDISKDSKDAVNGSQLYATNEAIANNYNNITNLNGRISNLDNRVNKVGAGAAALAALHPLDFDPDAKWDFAAGYGNYRGANAAAVGAYYRPNEDTMFSVGGTFGNGENMVNAGVSFKLGSGSSHVSTSRVAMAKEIKELRGELEAMKSAMLDANAGKKIDTSKLQLFPDVPQNHWAYEYVAQLAGNGMIEGYPDGNFAGDRPMTRYEFAAILYRAMTKGAVLSDKILSEFSHELEYFTVDTIAKDKAGNPTIQRVRTVKENKNK